MSKKKSEPEQIIESDRISGDLVKLIRLELLYALKQIRGFLNYTSLRLDKERKTLDSLVGRIKCHDIPDHEFERKAKAVQEAAAMFDYINLAYENLIKFGQTCFDDKSRAASRKPKKSRSKKVIFPGGSPDKRDELPSIHKIVTGNSDTENSEMEN